MMVRKRSPKVSHSGAKEYTTYKVLRFGRDGCMISSSVYGDAMVVYWPREESCAPEWLAKRGFSLTAFDKLSDAKSFYFANKRDHEARFCICLCKGVNPVETPEHRSNIEDVSRGYVSESETLTWPVGTCMYETIRPIRRVHNFTGEESSYK